MLYLTRIVGFCLIIMSKTGRAFIPHPIIAYGALSSKSITHAEITEAGFIRSIARFFYETRLSVNVSRQVRPDEYFTTEYTIDDLYEIAYPEFNALQAEFYSLPLKFVLDMIMTKNVLMDFDPNTKKLAAAHFDVISHVQNEKRELSNARESLGQLFHTLQDFYSHTNWIEMGKDRVNELIGLNETIGLVAALNQSTCSSNGCKEIEKPCTIWQQVTLGVCPLKYYDCQNNINIEINNQQILTSGYAAGDLTENGEVLEKPTNIEKCSHGSVLDASSHVPAIGGINKDSYSIVFSPHYYLHKKAADLAIKATEDFLNQLRRDIGDNNFDRLLSITPNETESQSAIDALSNGKRFRFFSSSLTSALENGEHFSCKLKRLCKRLLKFIRLLWTKRSLMHDYLNTPTYDLTDQGVDVKDSKNFRAAPYVFGIEEL